MNGMDIAAQKAGIRALLDSPQSAEQAREASAAALSRSRAVLQAIDSTVDPAAAVDMALLHLEALRSGADFATPSEKETLLRRADAHAQAALHLARTLGDADRLARLHEQACLIACERYRPDRDEALFDAMAHAEAAAALWRTQPSAREFDLPRVLMQKGNCALKVLHERGRSLAMAMGDYGEALTCIGAGTPRRLETLLKGNIEFAKSRIDAGNGDLPEMERVERYGAIVQQALDRGDAKRAEGAGWSFVAWSWLLDPAPNRHTGEAHQLLAKLAFARGDADEARAQQYQAVAVFSFLARRQRLPEGVLDGAATLLRQLVARAGRDEAQQQGYVELASQGLEQAVVLCEQVQRTITQDPQAAVAALDMAQRHYPSWPVLMFYDGVARSMTGDVQGALQAYNRHLSFVPRSARALINRAGLKLALGDRDGAKNDLDAARAIAPEDPALAPLAAQVAALEAAVPPASSDTA